MASRGAAVAVGVVGVAAGVALAIFAPATPGKPAFDGRTVAAEAERRIQETAAGVRARAGTLADLPRLAAAVSTDAETVHNLTRDELAFRTKPGELVAIAQIFKKAGTPPTLLLLLPADAKTPPPQLERAGTRLVVLDGAPVIESVMMVTPRERADELDGALAVSWALDLAGAAQPLVDAGGKLELVADGATVALGGKAAAGAERVERIELALAGETAAGAKLVALVPTMPARMSPLRPAGAALALLSLVAAALLARAKPAAQPSGTAGGARLASAPTTPTTPAPSGNRMIGRYEILRPLGSGGMAEVYLARASGEAGFTKLLALKVLHQNFAAQPIVVEHFLDEARLASRLTHPNIVQIADLGKADDAYFIAMEYVDGADLERLLAGARQRREWVPLRVAFNVLRKICDGLQYAHTALDADGKPLDLVHRDVKSANVFIDRNGAVKVGDFGIAKANVEGRVRKTEIGVVKGTAAYMAPEHRLGQVPLDRRADLFAVGAIGYEMLTGQQVDLDFAVLAVRGLAGWPHLPKPTEVRPELPPALDEILWKTLAYERDQRYANCAELEAALEKVALASGQVAGEKAVAEWIAAGLAAEAHLPKTDAAG